MEITCGLDEILKPDNCNDRGGIRAAYWFNSSDVDWDSMIAEPTDFDTTNHIILDYVMLNSATMNKINFEAKSGFFDFTYTSDADVYEILVQFMFRGSDNARELSFQKAIACCNIGLHLYLNDGTQRVVCQDYNGTTIQDQLEPLRVGRHLTSSGQLGTSKSREEIDLVGQSFFRPLFATVAESALPL